MPLGCAASSFECHYYEAGDEEDMPCSALVSDFTDVGVNDDGVFIFQTVDTARFPVGTVLRFLLGDAISAVPISVEIKDTNVAGDERNDEQSSFVEEIKGQEEEHRRLSTC